MSFALNLLVYGLVAFPLTLTGRVRRAAEVRERRIGNGPARPGSTLGALLPSLLAFVAALLVVYLVFAGWLYPIRPDVIEHLAHPFTKTPDLDGAWGGPTLIGAWLVHAGIALAMQALALAAIRGVASITRALARRVLGPGLAVDFSSPSDEKSTPSRTSPVSSVHRAAAEHAWLRSTLGRRVRPMNAIRLAVVAVDPLGGGGAGPCAEGLVGGVGAGFYALQGA